MPLCTLPLPFAEHLGDQSVHVAQLIMRERARPGSTGYDEQLLMLALSAMANDLMATTRIEEIRDQLRLDRALAGIDPTSYTAH